MGDCAAICIGFCFTADSLSGYDRLRGNAENLRQLVLLKTFLLSVMSDAGTERVFHDDDPFCLRFDG